MPGKSINVVLTSRGRLTIPRAVCARLCLGAGEKLVVSLQEDGAIALRRQTIATTRSLRGMLAKPARALTVAEMDAGITSAVALADKATKSPTGQRLR